MLLFLVDLINIEIFIIPFSFFYSFYFILRSRATSARHSETADYVPMSVCMYTLYIYIYI